MAGSITAGQARNLATQFIKDTKTPAADLSLTLAEATHGHYIFNIGNNQGFIIIAADNTAGDQILGFSDSGSACTSALPESLRRWLERYDKEAEASLHAISTAGAIHRMPQAGITSTWKEVPPMLTTRWGQGAPYNQLCPEKDGQTTMTGSMATALAQVMRYQRWPEHATGLDTGNTNYDWDSMTDTYNEQSTQQQKEAVARLMSDIGMATKTQYDTSNSLTYSDSAETALAENFSYAHNLALYVKDNMTTTDWYELIYNELKAQRPVVYMGGRGNAKAPQAFVCDGYKDGFFHINWGWGGLSDGYFKLSALTPDSRGEGSTGSPSFNTNERVLVGMTRHQEQYGHRPVIYSNDDMSINMPKADHNTRIVVNIATTYASPVKSKVNLGLIAVSEQGDTTFIAGNITKEMSKNDLCYWYDVNTQSFPTAEGTYTLYPAVQDVESRQWYNIYIHSRNNNHSMKIRIKGGLIYFSESGWDGKVKVSQLQLTSTPVYAGKKYTVTALACCLSGEYKDQLHVGMVAKDSVAYFGEESTNQDETHLMEGDSIQTKLTDTAPKEPGKYYMVVFSGEGFSNIVSDSVLVTVNEPYAQLMINNKLSVTDADAVDPNDIEIIAKIKCTQGHYDGKLTAYFTDNAKKEIFGSIDSEVALSSKDNDAQTIFFRGAFPKAVPGKKYIVKIYYIDEKGKTAAVPAGGTGYMNLNSAYFTIGKESEISTAESADAHQDFLIYGLDGTLLLRQKGTDADLSSLPKGFYIVKTGKGGLRQTVLKTE